MEWILILILAGIFIFLKLKRENEKINWIQKQLENKEKEK